MLINEFLQNQLTLVLYFLYQILKRDVSRVTSRIPQISHHLIVDCFLVILHLQSQLRNFQGTILST